MRKAVLAVTVVALAANAVALLPSAAAQADTMTASQLVGELAVSTPNPTGYDRSLFPHWVDADSDGCDTRAEILIAESEVPVAYGSACSVTTGEWASWYDGDTWTNASKVDIDHLVPLGEAWASGASTWTTSERQAYANDLGFPAALQVVTDNVNQSKGARDPAQWMPPVASVACTYVVDWMEVKYRWNLSIDTAERDKLDQVASGECGATPVTLPAKADTAALAPRPTVQRLSGSDRYGTAVAISQNYSPGVPVVYVATGVDYPDALSAAPAAARSGGPLLLTMPTQLPSIVKTEILRLQPSLIVVVGGTGVVSDVVYNALATLAPAIRRDAGIDRYATSRIINQRAFPTATTATAYVATGRDYPDALSASAAAGSISSPVILVDGIRPGVDIATRGLIRSLGIASVKVAGGPGVVSAAMAASLASVPGVSGVTRLAGADRYATSNAIDSASFSTAPVAYFAVGTGFADALAGAALAGYSGSPLFVVPGTCVPAYAVNTLTRLGTTQRELLGGVAALGSGVENLTSCATAQPTPPPTPSPAPTTPANPGDTMNCADFSTWRAAQDWYEKYLPYYGDVARLDGNNDGIACESLPGAP